MPGQATVVTNMLVEVTPPDLARVLRQVVVRAGSHNDEPGPQVSLQVSCSDDLLALKPQGWRIARREARFPLYTWRIQKRSATP